MILGLGVGGIWHFNDLQFRMSTDVKLGAYGGIIHCYRPVCSPSRSCCLARQRGSSQDLEGWPGSETHPSSCPVSWRYWVQSHQTPAHSSLLHGRMQHPKTGTSPGQLCPRSNRPQQHKSSVNGQSYRRKEITRWLQIWRTVGVMQTQFTDSFLLIWYTITYPVVNVIHLHCDETVVHHHLLGQEVCSYCRFVLVTKLLVHILVH